MKLVWGIIRLINKFGLLGEVVFMYVYIIEFYFDLVVFSIISIMYL